MKKYFLSKSIHVSTPEIKKTEIEAYRDSLTDELKKMGATENELSLVCNALILNSIKNNRQPEDVAWAILQ